MFNPEKDAGRRGDTVKGRRGDKKNQKDPTTGCLYVSLSLYPRVPASPCRPLPASFSLRFFHQNIGHSQ